MATWDIRQSFSHPDPAETNAQIMRDLERGVTSIHLALECSGQRGCIITNLDQLSTALNGVRADIATVSLGHRGAGSGASGAALLALWADQQDDPKAQKLAFNISPIGQLLRTGKVAGGIDAAIAKTAALVGVLADKFPAATSLEVEAVSAHGCLYTGGDDVRPVVRDFQPSWIARHERRDEQEPTLDDLLTRISPVDLVIVEGFKSWSHDKIEVRRKTTDGPVLSLTDANIKALVCEEKIESELPTFQPDSISEIADFIVDHFGMG